MDNERRRITRRAYDIANAPEIKRKKHEHYLCNRTDICERVRLFNYGCRIKALRKYGGQCVACHDQDFVVLTFDHKDDNGGKLRKSGIDKTGVRLYRKLINIPVRDDLQILCANCQLRKRQYGPDINLWPKLVF